MKTFTFYIHIYVFHDFSRNTWWRSAEPWLGNTAPFSTCATCLLSHLITLSFPLCFQSGEEICCSPVLLSQTLFIVPKLTEGNAKAYCTGAQFLNVQHSPLCLSHNCCNTNGTCKLEISQQNPHLVECRGGEIVRAPYSKAQAGVSRDKTWLKGTIHGSSIWLHQREMEGPVGMAETKYHQSV